MEAKSVVSEVCWGTTAGHEKKKKSVQWTESKTEITVHE